MAFCLLFFFNDTATTEIYTLSLHDALPIYVVVQIHGAEQRAILEEHADVAAELEQLVLRSEEHTSELQSQFHLVCRLLLEKKKRNYSGSKKLYTEQIS